MNRSRGILAAIATLAITAHAAAADTGEEAETFEAVASIFEQSCIRCHHSETTMKGDVALESHAAIFGADAVGVVRPGEPDRSRLLAMIEGDDPEMPRSAGPLSDEQVQAVRAWIEAGAPWPDADRVLEDRGVPDADWWSFKPIADVDIPELSDEDADWVRTPIDAFIIKKLREQDLSPSPEADRRTLLRRVYYDLTGLPPTYEQVQAFINDTSPDAYEKRVEKLLASPAYGERWARHWLDMAGYGDTHGFDKDQLRPNAYHYRDYVIRSLNDGKPYDRFIGEQIAGDVLYPGTADGVIGTGFIAAGPWDFVGHIELREGTTDKKLTRVLDRDEMVDTVVGGLTSLTVSCARCHTHKFDPITHEDYYRMQAVFAGVDRADRPFPAPERDQQREQTEAELAVVEAQLETIDEQVRTEGGAELAALNQQLDTLRAHRDGVGHASHGFHSDISGDVEAPAWVQVDLGEPTELAHIVLAPTYDDFNDIGAGFGFPTRFRVEVANDPAFETDVRVIDDRTAADVANPGVQPWVIDASGESARYIRVTATKRAPRQNDYIFALGELAAITPAGRNAARGQSVTASNSIEQGPRWGRANVVDGIYPAMSNDRDILPALAEATIAQRQMQADLLDESTRAEQDRLRQRASQLRQSLAETDESGGMVYAAASDFESRSNFTPPPNGEPRPVHILNRGEVTQPGKEVGPGAISALEHLSHHFDAIDDPTDEGQRRAALARWILDEQNPLTWRSIVNRVWHHHFGKGIVASVDDFGRMGAEPTHPELLDWLARHFRDNGRSLKDLHRMIVTSAAYRQASTSRSDMAAADSANRYLWRMNRRKLEAEAIRDSVMVVSGTLNRQMYGPGYQLFGLIDDHSPHYLYEEHDPDDPETLRRSVYRFVVRSVPDPFMETLDCADPSQNVHVRDSTLTALQALSLMNNPFMVSQSEHFADRVRREADDDLAGQVRTALRLALGREAEPEEVATLEPVAEEHGLANVCRLLLNSNEMIFID